LLPAASHVKVLATRRSEPPKLQPHLGEREEVTYVVFDATVNAATWDFASSSAAS
jgi:hypothetical protein